MFDYLPSGMALLVSSYIVLAYKQDSLGQPHMILKETRIAINLLLTHISLASFLWDIGKQCRTR